MDEKTRTELEAAAFRRLVAHLRNRTDVQNIDLMNLAGFCRNCLGDWYREAAAEKGIALEKDQAREIVYGMPPPSGRSATRRKRRRTAGGNFASSHRTSQLSASGALPSVRLLLSWRPWTGPRRRAPGAWGQTWRNRVSRRGN